MNKNTIQKLKLLLIPFLITSIGFCIIYTFLNWLLLVKLQLFSVKEIEKINRIYHFVKIEGYTLDGAKKALRSKVVAENRIESSSNHDEVILRLEQIKRRLIHLKSALPTETVQEKVTPVIHSLVPPVVPPAPKKPAAPKLTPPSTEMPSLFD